MWCGVCSYDTNSFDIIHTCTFLLKILCDQLLNSVLAHGRVGKRLCVCALYV